MADDAKSNDSGSVRRKEVQTTKAGIRSPEAFARRAAKRSAFDATSAGGGATLAAVVSSALAVAPAPAASKGSSDGGDTDLDCSEGEEWTLVSPSERPQDRSGKLAVGGGKRALAELGNQDYLDSDGEAEMIRSGAFGRSSDDPGASAEFCSGGGASSGGDESVSRDGMTDEHSIWPCEQCSFENTQPGTCEMCGTELTGPPVGLARLASKPSRPRGASSINTAPVSPPLMATSSINLMAPDATSDAVLEDLSVEAVAGTLAMANIAVGASARTHSPDGEEVGCVGSPPATTSACLGPAGIVVDLLDSDGEEAQAERTFKRLRQAKAAVQPTPRNPGASSMGDHYVIPLAPSSSAVGLVVPSQLGWFYNRAPVLAACAPVPRRIVTAPSPAILQPSVEPNGYVMRIPSSSSMVRRPTKFVEPDRSCRKTTVTPTWELQSKAAEIKNTKLMAAKVKAPVVEAVTVSATPKMTPENEQYVFAQQSQDDILQSYVRKWESSQDELQPDVGAGSLSRHNKTSVFDEVEALSVASASSSSSSSPSSSSSSPSTSDVESSEEEVGDAGWQPPVVRLPKSASEPVSHSAQTLNRLWPRLDTFHRQVLNWKLEKGSHGGVRLVNDLAETWEQGIRDDHQASLSSKSSLLALSSSSSSSSSSFSSSSSSISSSLSPSSAVLKAELLRYRGRLVRLFFNECFHRANAETQALFGGAGKRADGAPVSFSSKAAVTRIAIDERGTGELTFVRLVLPRDMRRSKPFPGDLLLLSEPGSGSEHSTKSRYFALGLVPQFNPWMPLDLETASALLERQLANRPRTGSAQGDALLTEPTHRDDILWVCVRTSEHIPARLTIKFLASLQTDSREFQALQSADHLSLWVKQALTGGVRSPIIVQEELTYRAVNERPLSIPSGLWDSLCQNFNPTQIRAIGTASRGSPTGCTIIQGPPGTGKTTTVLGVLSVFLAGAVPAPPKGTSQYTMSSGASFGGAQVGGKAAKIVAGISHDSRRAENADDSTPSVTRSVHDLRVLVCAPSNRALDELVSRIQSKGLMGRQGQRWMPNVVRHGHQASVREAELDAMDKNRRELSQMAAKINLEALVEQRMQMRRPSLSDLVGGRGGPTGASSTHKRLNDHAEKAVVHTPYVAPATVRRQVLRDAHIVATTLSGAGSKDLIDAVLEGYLSFDAIVVDEAAFATEPSALIPLKFLLGFDDVSSGAKGMVMCPAPGLSATLGAGTESRPASQNRAAESAGASSLSASLVLIGDPLQLSPTLSAPTLVPNDLSVSLMERLQSQYTREAAAAVVMLSEQYRMHADIVQWPSDTFYAGRLLTGHRAVSHGEASLLRALFGHPLFAPYLVHDLHFSTEEATATGSKGNLEEASFVANLVVLAAQRMASASQSGRGASSGTLSVGVIAPYARQVDLLRSALTAARRRSGPPLDVEVATVDSFQGREKDIVVLSCTRAPRQHSSSFQKQPPAPTSIGFLKDPNRLNVALTRAKHCLLVVCNSQLLQSDPKWSAMLHNARARGLLRTWQDRPDAEAGVAAGRPPRGGHQLRPQTFGPSAGGKGFAGTCHTCGETGHRSVACPQDKGGRGGGGGRSGSSGGRSSSGGKGGGGRGENKGNGGGGKGWWGTAGGGGKSSGGKAGGKGGKSGGGRGYHHHGKGGVGGGAAADYAGMSDL